MMNLKFRYEGEIFRRVKYALSAAKSFLFLPTFLSLAAVPAFSQVMEHDLQEFQNSSAVRSLASHPHVVREIEIHLGDQTAPVHDLHGVTVTLTLGQRLPSDCSIQLDLGGAWPAERMPDYQADLTISSDSTALVFSWTASEWWPSTGHGLIGKILVAADSFSTNEASFLKSLGGIVQVIDADLKRSQWFRGPASPEPPIELFPNPVACGQEVHIRGAVGEIVLVNGQGKEIRLGERNGIGDWVCQTTGLSTGIWWVRAVRQDGTLACKRLLVR